MPTCITAKVNITVIEGGTFDRSWQWKKRDEDGNPVAVDLTGYTARMQLRAAIGDADPLLDLELAEDPWTEDGPSAVYLDDAEDGTYRVYVNDEDSSGLCASHRDIEGTYNIFLYSPEGEAVFKQYGKGKVVAAVAR